MNGFTVGGTVKDSGMQEPINTYYFRHGSSGLSGVHVIGIKEDSFAPAVVSESPLVSAGIGFTNALKEFLFPEIAIRVTPVVMFRELF